MTVADKLKSFTLEELAKALLEIREFSLQAQRCLKEEKSVQAYVVLELMSSSICELLNGKRGDDQE